VDDRGSILCRSRDFFSSPGQSGRVLKVTTLLHLVPRIMRGAVPPLPIPFHGIVLSYLYLSTNVYMTYDARSVLSWKCGTCSLEVQPTSAEILTSSEAEAFPAKSSDNLLSVLYEFMFVAC
jgi:hypothetical protein